MKNLAVCCLMFALVACALAKSSSQNLCVSLNSEVSLYLFELNPLF